MGYDRIRYFNGAVDGTTLLSVDKASREAIVGNRRFEHFARQLGFAIRLIVDRDDAASTHQEAVNKQHAQIEEFPPETKGEIIPGFPLVRQPLVEFRPPINEDMTNIFNAYFKSFCEPNDAGLIIDHRYGNEHVIGSF